MACDDAYQIHGKIADAWVEMLNIPKECHLFCPKMSDDDPEDYDDLTSTVEGTMQDKLNRIAAGKARLEATAWVSLVMCISHENSKEVLDPWMQRATEFLTTCDACVRYWHTFRKSFRLTVMREYGEMTETIVANTLRDFDKKRIMSGLAEAVQILNTHGSMSSSKLMQHSESAVIAFYEALCDVENMACPENRVNFDIVFEKVQERKVLKVGATILPIMARYIFEEKPSRKNFAETGWKKLTGPYRLTEAQFDWAVNDHLAKAIETVNNPMAPDSLVEAFWDGFLVVLDAMSEDIVLHSLRGMQIPVSVYDLAFNHLARASPRVLALVVKALCALMEKSKKAFWDAFANLPPHQLVGHILSSPAFVDYANMSFEASMQVSIAEKTMPSLVALVTALMRSLKVHQRTDVCESLLEIFIGRTANPKARGLPLEGKTACLLAVITGLQMTLDGFQEPGYTLNAIGSMHYLNPVINCAVQHREMIIWAAERGQNTAADKFNTGNNGLTELACNAIRSALTLDAKAFRLEWKRLDKKQEGDTNSGPQPVERLSAELWQGYANRLKPGKLYLARAMLMATLPLRGVQSFQKKKTDEKLDAEQAAFNKRFEKLAAVVAKILERLNDFSVGNLQLLCDDTETPTLDPIVANVMHGDDSIRAAAVLLLNGITGQDSRSDSITRMVHHHSARFLLSFSETVDKLTCDKRGSENLEPWAPMHHVLTTSRDVLQAMCDSTIGLLRTGELDEIKTNAMNEWWLQQWQFVDFSFRRIRDWSHSIEKAIMAEFARDIIDHADSLLEQDGLIASAVDATKIQAAEGVTSSAEAAMMSVLNVPKLFTRGIVILITLRDTYLLAMVVKVLVKLFTRLAEYNMEPPSELAKTIHLACKRNKEGRYSMNTNLIDTQRAELLKALGDDEPEVVFIDPATFKKSSKGKKSQSTIDAWSRSGSSTPTTASAGAAGRSSSSLTPYLDRHGSTLPKLPQTKAVPKAKPDNKEFLAKRAAAEEEKQRLKEIQIKKAREMRAGFATSSNLAAAAAALGKKAAPLKSDMMVDSDESDSDVDDDEEDQLLELSKTGDKVQDEAERQRRLAMRKMGQGPVKKVKVIRSAKDMRARLIPPMGKLHQAVLEWDIFHEGDDPPNGFKCENVASKYPSPKEYKDTFFPLLVSEAWRSFVTSKDETTSKPFGIKVLSRMTVDSFLEVGTSIPVAVNKDQKLAEGDIVLLGKDPNPLRPSSRSEPYCLARIAKTQFKREVVEVSYRMSNRGNPMMQFLSPSMEFYGVKITNMTTIEREYAALESLQYYDLMGEVLAADSAPILNYGEEAIAGVQRNWGVNKAQGLAIMNAKANDGFTLVQGPPGTGKTKTIIAMVGAILTDVLKTKPTGVAIGRAGPPQSGDVNQKKLLVCAPSNAAVDELVLRLKAGIKDSNGVERKIKVLRLGRSDAISAAVRDVTLDELVKAELEGPEAQANAGVSDLVKLHQRAGEIKNELNDLRPALEAAQGRRNEEMAIQRKIDVLRTEQRNIGRKIDFEKDSGNTYAREAQIKRMQVQQRILNEAHVLCATLSGSGHEMFKGLNVEFETVIIDEAAQCVELSALIPLKYGCIKCILVGDPKQLPPTVLSQSAAKYGYDQSLFVRLQERNSQAVHLLDTQYRMHPDISRFPSKVFYEQKLIDGGNMAGARCQEWHKSLLLSPYRFFDVQGVQERGRKGQSLINTGEIQVAMQLYKRLCTDYSFGIDFKRKIGIITPYKAQLYALRDTFAYEYGNAILDEIEFNTTDAFQGRECEIIIFSCVRASATGGIGFMTDIRRMNVGLTRAKSSLWILGNGKALSQGKYWKQLIDDAQARDRYTTGDLLGMLSVKGPQVALPSTEVPDRSDREMSREMSVPDHTMNNTMPSQKDTPTDPTDDLLNAQRMLSVKKQLFAPPWTKPSDGSNRVLSHEMSALGHIMNDMTPSQNHNSTNLTVPQSVDVDMLDAPPPNMPVQPSMPAQPTGSLRGPAVLQRPKVLKAVKGTPIELTAGQKKTSRRRSRSPDDPSKMPVAKRPAITFPPERPDKRKDPSAREVLGLDPPTRDYARNAKGEIVVGTHGETNMPGPHHGVAPTSGMNAIQVPQNGTAPTSGMKAVQPRGNGPPKKTYRPPKKNTSGF